MIILAERGKLPLKFTCPIGTSTCPVTLLKKGELHCKNLPKTLLVKGGNWGHVLLAQLPFLSNSLAMGQVVMLHAAIVLDTNTQA